MAALRDVWIKKLGEHRGSPRLFLDASQAVRAGFAPGQRFEVKVDGQKVVLTKQADGSRVVSSRRKGQEQLPVIDINSRELLAAFSGMDSVRVVVGEQHVYLLPLASEIKKRERLDRVTRKVASGEPLAVGSIAHGGGILAHAIHQGLRDAGVDADLAFANEVREDLVAHAMRVNDAWQAPQDTDAEVATSPRTAALVVPMQELIQDDWAMSQLPLLEVLEMGLPCSGASKAGVAKRGLAKMEDHPVVGHLVFSALVILNKTQPAIVLLENVVDYKNTASAQILRQQLTDMGYTLHEAILEGADFGALENRVRWCLVGATKGVHFDFEQLAPTVRIVRKLGDVLEHVPVDDARWSTMQGLKDKQERDALKGSNFKMQTMEPEDARVPTLRKGYHKGGSTDPVLRHPDNPDLLRRLTAAEHARVKGVPEHLVEGLSETTAHQLLGQGIVYEPFRAVGERIGQRLLDASIRCRRSAQEASAAACEGSDADCDDSDDSADRARDWSRLRNVG